MKLHSHIATFILLFICCSTNAQSFAAKTYPERYSLEMPEDFKTPKFIEALTDIIPRKIGLLKDKQFCMGCTGGYSARLVITKPLIKDRQYMENGMYSENSRLFTYTITYCFAAYISILDSLYNNLGIIEIISPNDEMYFSKQFNVPQTYDFLPRNTDSRGRVRYDKIPRPVDPTDYIARNSKQFVLNNFDLIENVQQKVYELRRNFK